MRIINIIDIFHPDTGYLSNVLGKYMVARGHEYIILTTDLPEESCFFDNNNIRHKDRKFEKATGVRVIRLRAHGRISRRAIWNYSQVRKIVNNLNPDIVFIGGNDTLIAIQYIFDFRNNRKAIVTDSHMLEMASVNRYAQYFRWLYRKIITPKVLKYHIPVIRVQNDNYVQKCLGIPLSYAPLISFGSDTMLFHPDVELRTKYRKELSIKSNEFVVVYAGKLDESKGGKLLANTFLKKFNTERKVTLVVVGNAMGKYGQEVEDIFKKSENRILRFPTQKYMDLAKFYCIADLSVFAKQCSLSFYDAQACGLPVLSEDNNINRERCSHSNGWNFVPDSVQSFRTNLERIMNISDQDYQNYKNNALSFIVKNYDYEKTADKFEKIFVKKMKK